MTDYEDETIVVGSVVDADRGHLPYALVHGESLVACAAWALGQAGVRTVDLDSGWDQIQAEGWPIVLHDALCPMTPAEFVAECVEVSLAEDSVVVGVRPVTDTVKVIADGQVGATVDRDDLIAVTSPVVLPSSVVAALDGPPGSDLAALVSGLAAAGRPVRTIPAPAQGRRVASEEDLRVLEALTAPGSDERELLGY